MLSSASTGYIEYEAVVVRTMRNARRGFVNARYMEKVRLNDFAGAAAALWDRVEDASGGKGVSSPACSEATAFRRFLLRCGGSSLSGAASVVAVIAVLASSTPLLASLAVTPSCILLPCLSTMSLL